MDRDDGCTPEPGIATLLGGIVDDGRSLLRQQLDLFRSEVKQEVRQLRTGIVSLCVGAVVASMGAVFLLAMLAQLIHTKAGIELWASYGIVGGALAIVGVVLLLAGKKAAGDVELTPPPKTARELKENFAWLRRMKAGRKTA